MRLFLSLLLISLSVVSLRTHGAQAAFSKDKRHVFLVRYKSNELIDIDLAAKSFQTITVGTPARDAIRGIAASKAGLILCATGHGVGSFDPSTGKYSRMCDSSTGTTICDIAYDTASEMILVVNGGEPEAASVLDSDGPMFCLLKGATELAQVRIRYGTVVTYPVFAADGTLFFESAGDVWTGFISNGNNDINDPALELNAYRCAPLASHFEEDTSPPSSGVTEIAVGHEFIYACKRRMGGSGWGETLRFLRPPKFVRDNGGEKELPYSDDMSWSSLKRQIASIEKIEPDPFRYLCASTDGSLVLCAGALQFSDHPINPDTVILMKQDAKPVLITIKGLGESY